MVCILIGGTFDGLHKGHREFIKRAFTLADRVLVCITSDGMASRKGVSGKTDSYENRKRKLEGFLKSGGWLGKADIVKIEDPFTEGMRPELTHIVVSRETAKNAGKINAMRKESGMKELGIIEISWVMADDGKPVSAARIRRGEIDSEGKPAKKRAQ